MRDPIQPGRDRPAAILVAMNSFQHAQKDLGLEILGQLGFTNPKIDVAIDRRRIPFVDLRERGVIASLRTDNQLGLVDVRRHCYASLLKPLLGGASWCTK